MNAWHMHHLIDTAPIPAAVFAPNGNDPLYAVDCATCEDLYVAIAY